MTPNGTFGSGTTSSECGIYAFLGGNIDQTNSASRAVLVVLIIMSIIACPVLSEFQPLRTKTKLEGFVWSHRGITELISRSQIAMRC